MARSRNLYPVTKRFEIAQPNDPSAPVLDTFWDYSIDLSKKLGRTIRQGNSFRVVGLDAQLTGGTGGDLDTGFGANVRINYCPTTSYSAQAWRDMLGHYNKQKAFRAGFAGATKYDEFELAYTITGADDRTSMVYVGGLTDPTPEYCAIYGPYDDEDGTQNPGVISLQALCNAKNRVPGSSEASGGTWGLSEDDWLFNDIIEYKPPKFDSRFPRSENLFASATHSTALFYDHDIGIDDIYDSGANVHTSPTWLPSDNHVNMLTSACNIQVYVQGRDDENITADRMYLYVTLWIEGWSSLTINPKRKSRGYKSNYKRSRGSRYGR